MRVLYWSELFWPYIGGAEVLATRLLPALRNLGCEFVTVTSHDCLAVPDEEVHEGIPIRRLAFREALSTGNLVRLIDARRQVTAIKRAFRPDLVHVNSVGPSAVFHLQTLAAWQAPTLVTMQQEILPRHGAGAGTLMGRVLRSADWVSCVSAAVLEQVRAAVPELSDRTSVVYNAREVPGEPPAPLPATPPVLLCLGRLVPAKGFDLALRAMASLAGRYPAVRLLVAGEGPERASLEQQVRDLGLAGRVEFLGWIDPGRVPAVLNAASVVLMPSRREGLPFVAVEAAMMGRPIVATRVSGLPEVVGHEETGLLVEREDADALAAATARLLDRPALAARMGAAGRARATRLFGWEACVSAYHALYRRLAAGPRDPAAGGPAP